MKIISKSVVTAVVVGLMAIPVVSQAAVKSNQVDSSSVVISYSMDDLKSAKGRAALEREVRTAARNVCGSAEYSKTRSLQGFSDQRSCYHEAVSEALADLNTGTMQVTAR
jgi:UrcA family protein